MLIAFALYPKFTALDVIGPFNMLAYGPGVEAISDGIDRHLGLTR